MWKNVLLITVLILIFFLEVSKSQAFVSITLKISAEVAEQLAELGMSKGSKEVGSILHKMAAQLPDVQRVIFLEQAYVLILVKQGRLTSQQADEIIRNLSGTPGLQKTLSKMCGMNNSKASGHSFEVLAANELKKSGYEIIEIGKIFDDGIKNAVTDIDIVAKKGNTTYIFEMKNYSPTSITSNSLINFRADMQTLNSYANKNENVKSIFVISSKPMDINQDKLLKAAAKSQNIELIYADAYTLPILLEALK